LSLIIQLEIHNNKPFRRIKLSRRELYEQEEYQAMKRLPTRKYEFKKFLRATVQINYHVDLRDDKHYYSVPWRYKGKKVDIIYTNRIVEDYYQNKRIASHKRDYSLNKYTTDKKHMPSHHKFYAEWSPQRFIN